MQHSTSLRAPDRARLATLAVAASLLLGGTGALASGPTVEGEVLDADGTPVPGASIALRPIDAPALDPEAEPAAAAIADDAGRFRLAAPSSGTWRVVVEAPGFVPRQMDLLPLVDDVSLAPVRLPEDVGFVAAVYGPDAEPVAGAGVTLARVGPRMAFGPRVLEWEPVRRIARTDAEGVCYLPRADDERVALTVSARGFVPERLERIAGEAATVVLRRGAARALAVTREGGAEVEGARVVLAEDGHALGETDADGRLALTVPSDGELRVQVRASGAASLPLAVGPAPAEHPEAPRVVVLPATRTLSGRVIDAAARRALPGAVVWPRGRPARAVVTDRSGAFELEVPVGRVLSLDAGAARYRSGEARDIAITADATRAHVIALEPAATVEGVVVDGQGTPIAGATVRLAPKPSGRSMRMRIEIGSMRDAPPAATTDDDGAFRITGIDPERPWVVRAAHDAFAPGSVELDGLEPLRTKRGVRLTLPRGAELVGTVVDRDGAAIPDATVVLTHAPGGARGGIRVVGASGPAGPPRTATSDDDGAFRVSGLSEGTYAARVSRDGYASWSKAGVEVGAADDEVALGEVVLEPGVSVYGFVVDEEGNPIEGVAVRAREEPGGGPRMAFVLPGGSLDGDEADATTGPDGAFTVVDLKRDAPIALAFSADGYLAHTEADVVPPNVDPLEIALRPSSSLGGYVLDEEGEPLAGAGVDLERTVNMSMGNRMISSISRSDRTTDADGWFLFEDQAPGQVTLEASAPGRKAIRQDGIEIPRGEDKLDVELRMELGAVIVGRVTAPDGTPVSGATVAEVEPGGGGMRFSMGGGAATDGDGFYRLDGIEPGERSIEVTHPSYVRTVKDLEAKQGVNELDFVFEGGHAVRGVVVDAGGATVSGAWIQLNAAGRSWGGPEATSDGDGRFEIAGVGDGDYRIAVSAEGYAPYRGEDPVRVEGAPVEGLTVRLEPGAAIRGRVLGLDPEDLGRVQVEAFSLEGRGHAVGEAVSDGTYEVDGVGPGRWRVEASVGRQGKNASVETTVEAGANEARADLEFGRGVTLAGRVTLGGQAFADANVAAGGIDVVGSGDARTGKDGTFRLEGLEPGRYRIDFHQWSTGVTHREEVEVTSDREVEIVIPTARITGRVVDAADRAALSGVRLRLAAPDGESLPWGFGKGAVTDVDGEFRIENVPDGSWTLEVSRDGYAATSQAVQIVEARDVDGVDIRLEPTEGLSFVVRTPTGRAPESVVAAVLDPAGRAIESGRFPTGERGSVRLSRVPAGTWTVVLAAPGTAPIEVVATAPASATEVRLPEACVLRVDVPALAESGAVGTARLIDASGRPYRRLYGFGGATTEHRLAGGRLTLDAVPPGTWRIEVVAGETRYVGSATTAPGAPAAVTLE